MSLIKTFKILMLLSIIYGFYICSTVSAISFYCHKNQTKIKAFPTVVNGLLSHPLAHPYLAGLRLLVATNAVDRVFCGATIIDDFFLLTAAHCVYRRPPYTFVICINCQNSQANYILFPPSYFIVHPNYNERTFEHDIALIKVGSPISLYHPNFTPICLCCERNINLVQVIIAGWGDENGDGKHFPILLREGVILCSKNFCTPFVWLMDISNVTYNSQLMICCDGLQRGVGVGDSGGPLLYPSRGSLCQLGVISTILTVGNVSLSLSTSIPEYSQWLDQVYI